MTSLGTSLTVSSLHPFYIYWFSVAAYTVDLGPFTEPLMLQMPQDGKNDTTTIHSYINFFFFHLCHIQQFPALLPATTLQ